MPGDPNQHIYLSDHYPTKASKRLSYAAVGRLLVENGWPRDLKTLTTAIAVVTAESSRDPKGYLAYVDLGVDRNSAKGLAMRKKIDALPASTTLTTFRKKVKEIGGKVVRSDNGLFQIGRPPYEDLTIAQLMTPELNVQKALKLYKQRGWQPWAAYTTPRGDEAEAPYRRFLGDAEKAAKTVLAEG